MNIAEKAAAMRKNHSLENVRKEAQRLRDLAERQRGGKLPAPEHRSYDLTKKFIPAMRRPAALKTGLK